MRGVDTEAVADGHERTATLDTSGPEWGGATLARGVLLGGRYEIGRIIGVGGMAVVYQAHDRVTREAVAIKVLDPHRAHNANWARRFGRELRNARAIVHPNVCRVYDLAEADGHCFLTMELAGGGTLRDTLSTGEPVPLPRLDDAQALLDGVAAIHAAGIVHRDIKPENLLRDRSGRLMVSDFGLAVDVDGSTATSHIAGTPSYMAPELYRGEQATKGSDVYALGVVLHEVLFGGRPTWSDGRRLQPPRSIGDGRLFRVVATCLADAPAARPADAAAVRLLVERALRRRRWQGLRAPLAVMAAGAVLLPAPRDRDPRTERVVDVADVPPLVVDHGWLRCMMALPDRKTLRLIYSFPSQAVDVDAASGAQRAADLRPETYQEGCPQLFADGRLLFQRRMLDAATIYLSESADGSNARFVTRGWSPVWHPSGREFVFSSDYQQLVRHSFSDGQRLFPRREGDHLTAYAEFNERGDELVALAHNITSKSALEIYRYPELRLVSRVARSGLDYIHYDRVRSAFLVSVWKNRVADAEFYELTPARELVPRIRFQEMGLYRAARTDAGLAVLSAKSVNVFIVTRPDGERRQFFNKETFFGVPMSPAGRVLMIKGTVDDRLVLHHQGWTDGDSRPLTDGPFDADPSFGPEGKSVFDVRTRENAALKCDYDGVRLSGCRVVHVEPLGFAQTVVSPQGDMLAYLTLGTWKVHHLRVKDLLRGTVVDLGERELCRLAWASRTALWQFDRERRVWTYLEPRTGKVTAVTGPPPAAEVDPEMTCSLKAPFSVGQVPDGYQAQRTTDRVEEIRVVR